MRFSLVLFVQPRVVPRVSCLPFPRVGGMGRDKRDPGNKVAFFPVHFRIEYKQSFFDHILMDSQENISLLYRITLLN